MGKHRTHGDFSVTEMTRYDLTQIAAIAANLRAILGDDDDEQVFFDTLEGETDVMEIAGRLIARRVEAQASRDAMKAVAQTYSERAKRFDRTADACTAALGKLLDAIGEQKLPHALGTVSRTKPRERAEVYDETAIPSQLCKRVPDTSAIKAQLEAGEDVPGARLVMGEPGVMVRVK